MWLDGLEITQFTYFQQAGGMSLDPVSVEITYGVERIIMALQNVSHFKDIAYAPGISYGEAFGQAEYEMSRFYLDDADVETQKRLFEDYAGEARRLLDARLPVPAHLHVLKLLPHVQRPRRPWRGVARPSARRPSRGCARWPVRCRQLWAERRDELGHPLGTAELPPAAPVPTSFPVTTRTRQLLSRSAPRRLPPQRSPRPPRRSRPR